MKGDLVGDNDRCCICRLGREEEEVEVEVVEDDVVAVLDEPITLGVRLDL